MRRLATTTRGRLTLVAGGVLLVALVVTDVVLGLALMFTETGALDAELRDQAAYVSARIELSGETVTYTDGELPHETPAGTAIDLAAIGPGGVALATPVQPFGAAWLAGVAGRVNADRRPLLIDATDRTGAERRVYAVPAATSGGHHAVLVASTPLAGVRATIAQGVVSMAALSLAALIAGVLLTYVLIGRVLRPVARIAALAETLSERDLHRRVDVAVPDDEVGELARTFNRMLARLEASFDALRSFTSDASHELRSPLAVMGAEVELSLDRPRSAGEYRRSLGVLRAEIDGMSRMVDRLLLLARADAGDLRASRRRLDVVDFLHEAAARWQAVAERRGTRIELDVPDAGDALADEDLTRRALDNLIDNAIRYAGAAGPITVRARQADGTWLIQVMDRGPGVPDGLETSAFERFTRADRARAAGADGGAGLGLALSRAFMRAQDGDLRIGREAGWGAVFDLTLEGAPA